MIGVESGDGAPLPVYGNVRDSYCKVRRGRVVVKREAAGGVCVEV